MSVGRKEDEVNQAAAANRGFTGQGFPFPPMNAYARPCHDPERCLWRPVLKGQRHTHCSYPAGWRPPHD